MRILVTGAAGFIGSALCLRLLERGDEVVGLDNHNDYYDPLLKEARLARHINHPAYQHFRLDLGDREGVMAVFQTQKPDMVANMAAQAGVRYSIENPLAYIHSNIVGFAHVLEGCRHHQIKHLVYASSSSVYGANTQLPFSVDQNADHPLSFYAASKKSNELMAHSYSHLYQLPTTGLRFFTVYGPWGRPDMAPIKFAKAILADETIKVFNFGNHRRDFTYIDDIIEGVVRAIDHPAKPNPDWQSTAPEASSSSAPWRLYNIGNNQPVELMDFIDALETSLGRVAKKELLPLQQGDLPDTFADVTPLMDDFGYKPATSVKDGVENFACWFKDYYLN